MFGFLFGLVLRCVRFAQPQVVQSYVAMLKEFKKNTEHTNHCVVKMLHRIGFQSKLVGMLYQASLFRVLQALLFDPACNVKHFQVMFGLLL